MKFLLVIQIACYLLAPTAFAVAPEHDHSCNDETCETAPPVAPINESHDCCDQHSTAPETPDSQEEEQHHDDDNDSHHHHHPCHCQFAHSSPATLDSNSISFSSDTLIESLTLTIDQMTPAALVSRLERPPRA